MRAGVAPGNFKFGSLANRPRYLHNSVLIKLRLDHQIKSITVCFQCIFYSVFSLIYRMFVLLGWILFGNHGSHVPAKHKKREYIRHKFNLTWSQNSWLGIMTPFFYKVHHILMCKTYNYFSIYLLFCNRRLKTLWNAWEFLLLLMLMLII